MGGVQTYDYRYSLPVPFQAAAGTKYWVQIEAFQGGAARLGALESHTSGTGTISANLRMKASTGALPATPCSRCWGQRSTHIGFTFHSYSDSWCSFFLWTRVYGGSTEQILLVEDTDGGDARHIDRGRARADLRGGSPGRAAGEASRDARFLCAPDPKCRGPGPHPPHPRSSEALGHPHTSAHGDPVADPCGDPRATTPGDTRAGEKCHSDPGERVWGRRRTGIKWRRCISGTIAPGDNRHTCRYTPPNLVVTTGSRACRLDQSDLVAVSGCPFSEHAGYSPGIGSGDCTYRHAYPGRDSADGDLRHACQHTKPDPVAGHSPTTSAHSAGG